MHINYKDYTKEINAECDALERELAGMMHNDAATIRELRQKVSVLESVCQHYIREIKVLTARKEALEADEARLNAYVQNLEHQLDARRQDADDRQKLIEKYEMILAGVAKALKQGGI